MADILSQDEVDMLLATVSGGEIDESTLPSTERFEQTVLTTYDFRRPERVSKEQLKGLQSLFEAFARELSITMPPFLRTVVRVDLTSIDQLTYDEFILSVARPTSLAILDMSPLDGRSVLELGPAMVFPIVDRLMGGRGTSLAAPREMTEIENRIIYRIVLMIIECWRRSWENLIEFKMGVVDQESDPLIVQIVAGSEMVILVGYEVYIGETVGSMNMCVPLLVLNPILDQISQQAHFQRKMSPQMAAVTHAMLERKILRTSVPVDAILGQSKLLLSDLTRLQVGDIVPLDASVNIPISVEVGGTGRFLAHPGKRRLRSSVQLVALVRD